MRRLLTVRALLTTLLAITGAHAEAGGSQAVWRWNPSCKTPTHVALRVLLDGASIYATSLPLCQGTRDEIATRASFSFTPKRAITWYGYRSDSGDGTKDLGETTAPGETLEVEFWQAGGEPDAIELGYTVSAIDGIHMNSIYILSPTRSAKAEVAPGLSIETQPMPRP